MSFFESDINNGVKGKKNRFQSFGQDLRAIVNRKSHISLYHLSPCYISTHKKMEGIKIMGNHTIYDHILIAYRSTATYPYDNKKNIHSLRI